MGWRMIYFSGLGVLGLIYGFLGIVGTQAAAGFISGDSRYFQTHLTAMLLIACLIAGGLSYLSGIYLNQKQRRLWREDPRARRLYPKDRTKYKSVIPTAGSTP